MGMKYTVQDTYELAHKEIDRCADEKHVMVLFTSHTDPITGLTRANVISNVGSSAAGVQDMREFVEQAMSEVAIIYGN